MKNNSFFCSRRIKTYPCRYVSTIAVVRGCSHKACHKAVFVLLCGLLSINILSLCICDKMVSGSVVPVCESRMASKVASEVSSNFRHDSGLPNVSFGKSSLSEAIVRMSRCCTICSTNAVCLADIPRKGKNSPFFDLFLAYNPLVINV